MRGRLDVEPIQIILHFKTVNCFGVLFYITTTLLFYLPLFSSISYHIQSMNDTFLSYHCFFDLLYLSRFFSLDSMLRFISSRTEFNRSNLVPNLPFTQRITRFSSVGFP